MLNECDNKQIAHVAVKPPPFWKHNRVLWFARLEAQFDLAKVSNNTTKFSYVLSAVESDIFNSVNDLVLKPPENGKYEGLELGDQKPSQLLTRMRTLGGDKVGEPLLKSLWLGRLPNGTQTILAALNKNLDQLAIVADKINDLAFPQGINSVAATSDQKTAQLEQQIAQLTQQVSELTSFVNRSRSPARNSNHFRNRSNSRNRFKSSIVDASNTAVGAALNCLTENGPQPIAFFSRKLSETETKYSTYDRELLAIYLVIKHFRHQLEGYNFIIFTEHRPLTFTFNQISDSCSPRQLRHLDFVSQLSTDIRHVSGSDNSVADALSRINALNLSTTDLRHLADSQTKDEELKTKISSNDLSIKLKPLKMGNALEIFYDVSREKVRPYMQEELRFEVFRSLHNLSHPGIRATKRLIQDRFI
ncbi:transposon Tf2-8 polyprotein [Nephila pilipes]|uniref:Transposon Tf2-8 polyprotein n=1 Tax=Nephila pilipes TaxID=299642 RepID=A0A8X6QVC2_NEPPI|nr:transposon Tf2-8 polyprotein [Nephila pilipes]